MRSKYSIYIVAVPWSGKQLVVKQLLGPWLLFKATEADLDMVRSWVLGEPAVTVPELTQQPFSQMADSLSA